MKTRRIITAIAAASLNFTGAAFAQGNPNNGEQPQPQRHSEHAQPQRGQVGRGHQARYDGRGAGPSHNFYRGGRLPSQYRDHRYVVNDWRGHHLSAPPRGYQWVQTGDDFVLAAIATGVIASVLLNSH